MINLTSFYRQAREVAIVWSGVCLVLIGVAFLLKMADEFSRGATLSFFVLGLGSMLVWRRFLARFVERAFAEGTFAPRKVIVIGEQDRLMASPAMLEISRCGYAPIRTFQVAPAELEPDIREVAGVGQGCNRDGTPAIRCGNTFIDRMGAQSTIETIAKMLNVLPIPIYLLPDTNVARYLDHRAITVGTTFAAEIQRAPLTRTEQFFKRFFDLIGAAAVLFLLSPLMLITALLIKLDSPGPVCFSRPATGSMAASLGS